MSRMGEAALVPLGIVDGVDPEPEIVYEDIVLEAAGFRSLEDRGFLPR